MVFFFCKSKENKDYDFDHQYVNTDKVFRDILNNYYVLEQCIAYKENKFGR